MTFFLFHKHHHQQQQNKIKYPSLESSAPHKLGGSVSTMGDALGWALYYIPPLSSVACCTGVSMPLCSMTATGPLAENWVVGNGQSWVHATACMFCYPLLGTEIGVIHVACLRFLPPSW